MCQSALVWCLHTQQCTQWFEQSWPHTKNKNKNTQLSKRRKFSGTIRTHLHHTSNTYFLKDSAERQQRKRTHMPSGGKFVALTCNDFIFSPSQQSPPEQYRHFAIASGVEFNCITSVSVAKYVNKALVNNKLGNITPTCFKTIFFTSRKVSTSAMAQCLLVKNERDGMNQIELSKKK